ncbi:hypothetical protein ABEF95_007402 [Exophiala dermatitidis]|uniref:Uncharacterized protein n=1 Tax=Exophiala dermatitidis (strain ATCC 34100 / CBS 525.76 / NIH/UT8656) TaxID=858893 RepID=H6BYQ5_EXODN|nr:uncharacterized protein HMPREF1120_04834 [Exophiala dermatitidis NIH/UT8656]EHY56768.1 hypothetical protein HMPREF1120_04834 [Exophiala dermatitidis NIH/UT8656]
MSPTKSSTSTSTSSSNTPLSERSPNTSSPIKATNSLSEKVVAMDDMKMPRFDHTAQKYTAHTQGQQTQTYISPSDAMQSPTTKKLSEIKGRRFMNAKPQTLFAKTLNQESLRAQSRN